METEKKRKINKVIYSIIFGILLIWIIIAIATCGGDNEIKTPKSEVTNTRAWQIAKDMVRDKLKSPSTADFPWAEDGYRIEKDSIITIQGHVDSQNSFGAMIRMNFIIKMQYKGGDWADRWNWQELEFVNIN